MRKNLFQILSISLILLCLVSCKSATNITSQNTTITIASRDGTFINIFNAVKGQFEKTHNCTINIVALSSDEIYTNTLKDIKNDVASYDIIMVDDPLMPEYIQKDVLCNLTQLGYTDDEDFVEKSRLLGKAPYPLGATFALPFSGNVQLIFYNADLVGQNIDLSNWNAIYDVTKEVNNRNKCGYAIRGQSGNPIVSDFLPILWAFGGDLFDNSNNVILYSDNSKEALNFYCKLYKTGCNFQKDELVAAISNGEAAIGLGWPTWFISESGVSAEIAQIPGKKDSSSPSLPTGEIGNWLLGITNNSANKELALELITFLTSREVQKEAVKYGGIPTRTSVFRDSEIITKYPYFDVIYQGTNNSRVRPRTAKWSKIEEVFGEQLVKCINGEQSVDETLQISQEKIEELISE